MAKVVDMQFFWQKPLTCAARGGRRAIRGGWPATRRGRADIGPSASWAHAQPGLPSPCGYGSIGPVHTATEWRAANSFGLRGATSVEFRWLERSEGADETSIDMKEGVDVPMRRAAGKRLGRGGPYCNEGRGGGNSGPDAPVPFYCEIAIKRQSGLYVMGKQPLL